MELIAVIAIALVLGGILLGVGNQIRVQGNVRLAESTIDVIVCALEQYYAVCDEFPFTADVIYDGVKFGETFDIIYGQIAGTAVVTITGSLAPNDWSSGALYYFLQKIPNSNNIITAVNEGALTTKKSGTIVKLDLDLHGDASVVESIFFSRFIDPWGRSFIYTYNGGCFPEIVSAGPDGVFGSGDDISNKH